MLTLSQVPGRTPVYFCTGTKYTATQALVSRVNWLVYRYLQLVERHPLTTPTSTPPPPPPRKNLGIFQDYFKLMIKELTVSALP